MALMGTGGHRWVALMGTRSRVGIRGGLTTHGAPGQ
ncbi:unnamed protein product [Staurois parvus]|uniref:Uncharacterized protein n=1 Tax=Staurois parvus TaxID=386267 RepID=A0ABN9GEZ4_9NEOB|nr:unnamed protein product [Staurois parvus]